MKQHITIDQLNELSEQGKEKLRKWWKPQEGDWLAIRRSKRSPWEELLNSGDSDWGFEIEPNSKLGNRKNLLPLLSIGQMIEFLDQYEPNLEIKGIRMTKSFLKDVSDNTMIWEVFGSWSTIDDETDLCNALWESVKEVLER